MAASASLWTGAVTLSSACVGYLDADAGLKEDGDGARQAEASVDTSLADGRSAESGPTDASGEEHLEDGACGLSRYARAVIEAGPVLYLRFGETPGSTTAQDEVDSGVTGTYPPHAVALGVPGAIKDDCNTAVDFDASGSIEMPESVNFEGSKTNFTIEVWIKPESGDAAVENEFIVDHEQWGPGRYRAGYDLLWQARRVSDELHDEPDGGDSDGSSALAYESQPMATSGEWHYIVATFDEGEQYLWVDGDAVFMPPESPAFVDLPALDGDWSIGAENGAADGFQGFIGTIDELAIYAYPLSEDEILAHYEAAGYLDGG